jgi:tetratricopeptide (TPR) repeat protein
MRGKILTILFLFLYSVSWGQADKWKVRQGNASYEKGKYQDAELEYRRALEKNPKSTKAAYNLSITMYRLNKPEEAEKLMMKIAIC